MGYDKRKQLLGEVEQLRERPLITYITSLRPGMSVMMASDAIRPFINQLEQISKEEKSIDLLIVSNGGDPITSLRIMGLLRERFDNVSVLLPYVAYSAATILALGADEIVMSQYSNLGPVDPQMTVSHRDASGKTENFQFGSEDIINFIEFIRTDVGVSDQQHLMAAAQPLINQVGPLSIGNAKRSQRLSIALSEKMLNSHISEQSKVTSIAKALNSSYYHHGYAVGRKEAKEIGLPVIEPDEQLEKYLWDIWLDYEEEMKCNDEFNVMKEIMEDPKLASIVNQLPIVNIPVNIPEPQKQAIFSNIVSNLHVTNQQAINKKHLVASIESARNSKDVYVDMIIQYWRDINMKINFNVNQTGTGWVDYKTI